MGSFTQTNRWSDEDYRRARSLMVERQLAGRDVRHPAVLEVMRRVPRHLFVPEDLRHEAYDDTPLPIGCGQTISQPYIVASMTEHLAPEKSKSVFEIGTGSGYQTAVLAELFGRVVTVEYFPELARQAREILTRLGYANIEFHTGNGLAVPATAEKFDAIMLTAAPEKIPEVLIDRLAMGGRMILPVGSYIQYLKLALKDPDGRMEFATLYPVRFVPLQERPDEGE